MKELREIIAFSIWLAVCLLGIILIVSSKMNHAVGAGILGGAMIGTWLSWTWLKLK